jgi:hypothetical protein
MSADTVLVIIGILLIVMGAAELTSGTHGFRLKNVRLEIGGTNTQTNQVGNVTRLPVGKNRPNWVGLAIAALGLILALIGLFKS